MLFSVHCEDVSKARGPFLAAAVEAIPGPQKYVK